MGFLELIAGLIIGISIGSLDREPILPNDSTRVSQEYYNVYYDVHFRGSYSNPYWNVGYYYPHTTYYVDTPRYVYVKPKKKRSGEYRRDRNKGGHKGSKSRGGRRVTRRK